MTCGINVLEGGTGVGVYERARARVCMHVWVKGGKGRRRVASAWAGMD